MIFTTYTYLVFFLATLAVYALAGKYRPYVMILAGFVFYAYDSVPYFFMLIGMTIVVYLLSRRRNKSALVAGLVFSVGSLAYFKYYRMAASTWNAVFAGWFGVSMPYVKLAVPLAISFFVFEFVHYLTDVYKGKAKGVSFREFMLFIFFFPSMVAGPIKRIESFEAERFSFTAHHVREGLTRMGIGLFKKVAIADTLNPLFLPTFLAPHHAARWALWVAMYAYAFKIYLDFSSYSDMAIGAARCLGFHLPENFNWPYIAKNLTEFWRRWHISLSTWIRDYLYIPLGGNRRGYTRMLLNIFLAMTISGLWHGAMWTFVLWGAWHGVGQVAQKLWDRWKGDRRFLPRPIGSLVAWLITFHYVCFGWIFFESPSIHSALVYFARLLGVLA